MIALQALTFNKIAAMQQGRIETKYRRIACQVPTYMSVIVNANVGTGGWIRLQVKVCHKSAKPYPCLCSGSLRHHGHAPDGNVTTSLRPRTRGYCA